MRPPSYIYTYVYIYVYIYTPSILLFSISNWQSNQQHWQNVLKPPVLLINTKVKGIEKQRDEMVTKENNENVSTTLSLSLSLSLSLYIYVYIHTYIYMCVYVCLCVCVSVIHHWRIRWSSFIKLNWVGFESKTTKFRPDAITQWAIRPWVQLALRANLLQLFQFHRLFTVRFHFGYCLRKSRHLF